MGWNANAQVLSKSGGFGTKLATNGQGDLQLALKSSQTGQIALFANAVINPHATFKAFKNAAASFADATAWHNARQADIFGFTSRPAFYPDTNPNNVWAYTRPTPASYSLRPYDFVSESDDIHGYQANAAPCFTIAVGQLKKGASQQSQVVVFVNDAYNYSGREGSGRTWVSGNSLSLSDLMSGYMSYYLTLLFIVNGTKNVVITKYTLATLLANGTQTIELYIDGNGSSNPSIPNLSSAADGSVVTVVAYAQGTGPSAGLNYQTITSNLDAYNGYSLAFESGIDRADAPVSSGIISLNGTTVEFGNVSCVNVGTDTDGVGTWDKYWFNDLRGIFDTTGAAHWAPSTLQLPIDGTLVVNAGTMKVGKNFASAQSQFSFGGTALLSSNQANQIKTLSSDVYVWILRIGQSVPQTITFDYTIYDNGSAIWSATRRTVTINTQ